jgi:hypothetical protein
MHPSLRPEEIEWVAEAVDAAIRGGSAEHREARS